MSDVIIYTTDDGASKIDLRLEDGTVWLSQLQIAELFQTTKQNVSKHIKAIYDDEELNEQATVNQQLTVQKEGNRKVSRTLALYNLDMILAVGYRVRSVRGIQFRQIRGRENYIQDASHGQYGEGSGVLVDLLCLIRIGFEVVRCLTKGFEVHHTYWQMLGST